MRLRFVWDLWNPRKTLAEVHGLWWRAVSLQNPSQNILNSSHLQFAVQLNTALQEGLWRNSYNSEPLQMKLALSVHMTVSLTFLQINYLQQLGRICCCISSLISPCRVSDRLDCTYFCCTFATSDPLNSSMLTVKFLEQERIDKVENHQVVLFNKPPAAQEPEKWMNTFQTSFLTILYSCLVAALQPHATVSPCPSPHQYPTIPTSLAIFVQDEWFIGVRICRYGGPWFRPCWRQAKATWQSSLYLEIIHFT